MLFLKIKEKKNGDIELTDMIECGKFPTTKEHRAARLFREYLSKENTSGDVKV